MKTKRRVSPRKRLSKLDFSEIEARLYEKYQYKKGKPGSNHTIQNGSARNTAKEPVWNDFFPD
jgi:hypothetical protein